MFKYLLGELPELTNDVLQMTYTGRPVCAYFKHAGTMRRNAFVIY